MYKDIRKERELLGLCRYCGKKPLPGYKFCEYHTEYLRLRHKNKRDEIRSDVYFHYGNKCSCCGETNSLFLTLDHVNNDGANHRRTLYGETQKASWSSFYKWIIENDYPKSIQLLCANCNLGKARNNGICPHQND